MADAMAPARTCSQLVDATMRRSLFTAEQGESRPVAFMTNRSKGWLFAIVFCVVAWAAILWLVGVLS
jgi:hypothetical protein